MSKKNISIGDQTLLLKYPAQATDTINFTFPDHSKGETGNSVTTIEISYHSQNKLFSATDGKKDIGSNLDQTDLALFLLSRISFSLANNIHDGIAVQGTAVHRDGNVLLMPGKVGSGKSILTTWLLSRGYGYLTDNLAYIPEDSFHVHGLTTPIHIKQSALENLPAFSHLQEEDGHTLQNKNSLLFSHRIFDSNPIDDSQNLSLLLFLEYSANVQLTLDAISPAQAAQRLMGSVVNGQNLKLHGFHQVSALTRKIPALILQYSDFNQLEDTLEPIIDFVFDTERSPSLLNKFIKAYHHLTAKKTYALPPEQQETPVEIKTTSQIFPIQKSTPKGKKKKLTIGMATYDDYDGVYFSVQALRMYHPEIINECEILVIDNHPDGPCAESLKNIDRSIDNYRYVPLQDVQGTAAARDYIFHHAAGDYVLCIDCHVLIVPGAIKKLFDYFNAAPNSIDLLQGPMIHDDLKTISTHFNPVWSGGMYGTWGHDAQGDDPSGDPFDIPMQGVGLFACRKKAWPAFNPRFYGFGADEGYIHEKFRQAGGRTLCLPFLRWLHRFGRPLGVPYPIQWKDRIHNYLVGFDELGMEIKPVKEHFIEFLGKEPANKIFQKIETETKSPFNHFDAIYCITLDRESDRWQEMQLRFKALGIAKRIQAFKATETPENQRIGAALAHRTIIMQAKQQNLNNVLVFEEKTLFLDRTLNHLATNMSELKEQPDWNIFYLGGYKWEGDYANSDGCSHLQKPYGLTCSFALAYNNYVYDRIIAELPETIDDMSTWITNNYALDRYLRRLDGLLLASPVIASQNKLLAHEKKPFRDRFTLGN